MEIGIYQGLLGMARELGERDMVNLLQQTIEHEQLDLSAMQELLPALLRDSRQQKHAA